MAVMAHRRLLLAACRAIAMGGRPLENEAGAAAALSPVINSGAADMAAAVPYLCSVCYVRSCDAYLVSCACLCVFVGGCPLF